MKTVFRRRWYFFAPLILVALIGFGFITMWLWNSLMPVLFHLPEITFWKTIGLMVLSRLLIGGFGGHSRGHHHWRANMHAKWEKMTPEEREQFQRHLLQHRHPWGNQCYTEERIKES